MTSRQFDHAVILISNTGRKVVLSPLEAEEVAATLPPCRERSKLLADADAARRHVTPKKWARKTVRRDAKHGGK